MAYVLATTETRVRWYAFDAFQTPSQGNFELLSKATAGSSLIGRQRLEQVRHQEAVAESSSRSRDGSH